MKNIKFYVCPICGNVMTATEAVTLSCCDKKVRVKELQKASQEEKLVVEKVENDYFISTTHEQSKEHHISFVAILTGDTMILRKQYPEWEIQARMPFVGKGLLVWHCTIHGLYYQIL